MKEKILRLLIKRLDVKGLAIDLVADIVDEALEKLVQDSSNPYDNQVKSLLWPLIEAEVIARVEKIDLEKLLGLGDEEA